MNAPKKIWYDPQAGFADEEQQYPEDIPYIRADIVDELVETLKEGMTVADFSDDPVKWFEWRDRARAALAKLEESHD